MDNAVTQRNESDLAGLPPQMRSLMGVSQRLARSNMIPKHYIGKPDDILVALQTGFDLGLESFVVALNEISMINGKSSISSKLAMALAKKSGVFSTDITFEQEGKTWDDLRVWAKATRRSDGQEVKADTSIKMAIAEGWTKNPKYKSMPVQMLSYRSAMFLIRRYAPEVLLGIQIIDIEAADIRVDSNSGIEKLNANIEEQIGG